MECGVNEFILQSYLKDVSICDDLINFHKKSDRKQNGVLIKKGKSDLNLNEKKSTDVYLLEGDDLWEMYTSQLQKSCELYIEKFSYCNNYSSWTIREPIQIQHYKPNEGFYAWHTERTSSVTPNSSRHLVFMTYLNDVNDGGETEWYYQKLKVKPKKGLTVIWPADWTHTHRGIPSYTQEKYIVTGWFNYF
jgi:hypothetical protein